MTDKHIQVRLLGPDDEALKRVTLHMFGDAFHDVPTYDAAIALYTKLGVREDVLHFDIGPSS